MGTSLHCRMRRQTVEPVDVGQAEVEDDGVRVEQGGLGDPLLPVGRDGHVVTGRPQPDPQGP